MSYLFEANLSFAQLKDRNDPLHPYRSEFHYPRLGNQEAIYFCGNSLGLQCKKVEAAVNQELSDWQQFAVGGYLNAKNPWLFYQQAFCKPLSSILGCLEEEVTVMNSLTVNLHLLLLSFYHPTEKRYKILIEENAFPSDQYAFETQIRFHNYIRSTCGQSAKNIEQEDYLIEVKARHGEKTLREEDILSTIEKNQDSLALVLMGGINYYSGQFFDIQLITAAAHQAGALAGFDLAHAAGNTHLELHDWNVDFAVWCSYKYLNGGPGSTGGAYIHSRYAKDIDHIRMGGWWGNDEKTRFKMEKGFIPKPDASGWNLSTAPVFNLAALKASLELFEEAGIQQLLDKSRELTAYLEFLLLQVRSVPFDILTPTDPGRRGAQLSLFFRERGKQFHDRLNEAGIIVDYREPGVIRVAPAPFYNSFEEVYRFYEILKNFE